jgi:hypothetical protein
MIRLRVGMCGANTETLAIVRDFTFFIGMSKFSEIFIQYFYTSYLFCPNFLEFLELHKYG